jgi:S-methylmethionine-dependent homocysteine/selenocysteine methylase
MVGGPTFTEPIIQAAQTSRIPFWVGFSAFEEIEGHGLHVYDNAATSLDEALPALIQLATEGPEGIFGHGGDSGADVIGAMHCKPAVLGNVLLAVQSLGWSGPMMAYPDDIQEWDPTTKSAVYGDDAVDVFCTHCVTWRREFPKCSLLGACCGFSVKHIAALNQRLREETFGSRSGGIIPT